MSHSKISHPEIAILGGYGAVGTVVARTLDRAFPDAKLRVGGRDLARAAAFVAAELRDATAVAVDIGDDDELTRFCAGAHVVVNCAGPSYLILDRVAQVAFAQGCDYVDPGGDEPVFRTLSGQDLGPRAAVLTAGMMPGLTGLLPRWLATQEFDEVSALTAYVGTMDRLTPAGAAEYLLSLGGAYGEAQAAWRGGERVLRVSAPRTGAEVPFFPGRVDLYPYLSFETERTARALGLADLDWFTVFDGGAHMMKALSRLQGAMTGQADLAPAAEDLTRAAALDLFGREPYQQMVIELTGRRRETPLTRTLVLRGNDTYELTGAVTAMATSALIEGRIPAGVHFAAEVLPADAVVEQLRRLPAVSRLELLDGPADSAGDVEEGEL
jgi:Saccharopine dehydrogenase NADP binding domain